MHVDELRSAVTKVVDILERSQIRTLVDQYRSARDDQRTAASVRLGHAGALIMEQLQLMSSIERQVIRCLHLEALGGTDYWQSLLGEVTDRRKHQAEIVRLASRVMFASSHLPALINLLDLHEGPAASDGSTPRLHLGEAALCIRLTDAGEQAADPDRIARSIDGIDMLYSACASISRKPVLDLRLDAILAKPNRDRELHFVGEHDVISDVYAVIDSIPAVLAEIDPQQDINLDAVVRELPVFTQLNQRASSATISRKEFNDISDTMHQGALLTLESGVILVDRAAPAADSASGHSPSAVSGSKAQTHHSLTGELAAVPGIDSGTASTSASAVTKSSGDEHYDRYLREREAMLQGIDDGLDRKDGPASIGDAKDSQSDDQRRRDSVEELLKALEQSRRS